MRRVSRTRSGWVLVCGIGMLIPLMVGQGCPGLNLGPATGGSVTVRSPAVDRTVAAGEVVTIVYDASGSNVRGFIDVDGVPGSGDEIFFANNLSPGTNRFTQLQTSGLSAGTYHIGIVGGSVTGYAPGRITVTTMPSVIFTSPVAVLNVGAGTQVPLRFSAGSGVTNFTYRLFYDTDNTFNNNEITIATGQNTDSNIVERTWDTTGLEPGTYFVGARIVVDGGEVTGYAGGSVNIVTGAFVQVLSPTIGLVAIPGTQIPVIIAAADPTNISSNVRIFYDSDNTFGNGNEVTIETVPTSSSGTVWNTTGIATGSYYVGAELLTGLSPTPVSYSAGPVIFVEPGSGSSIGGGTGGPGGGSGTERLALTTPLTTTTVFQGTTYRINWRTNLSPGQGTVTVFREPDFDDDGVPDGDDKRVVIGNAGLDAAQRFVDFDTTGVKGTYFIGATLTPIDGDPETTYAPGLLEIRPLVFWVGDLGTRRDPVSKQVLPQTGAFQGAVFRGFNFNDHLGSAMLAGDDYDGDGINELILAAQFGKPFNFTQGGRGAGEAYMIYGQRQRFRGDYDVNTTGSNSLPGVVFTGILPNPYPGNSAQPIARAGNSIPYRVDGTIAEAYDTEGLRSITLIPDQDGDGKRELVFGFPWCNSLSLRYQAQLGLHPSPLFGMGNLENNGHFLRGGLVVLASTTPVLTNRTALSRTFDRVVQLHEVGQLFGDMRYNQDTGPVRVDNCPLGNPDGLTDTILYPHEGFWQDTLRMGAPRLADPLLTSTEDGSNIIPWEYHSGGKALYNHVFLSQVDPPPGPTIPFFVGGRLGFQAENQCPTAFDPPAPPFGVLPDDGEMWTIGTGFYTVGNSCAERTFTSAIAPFGCRILGQDSTQPQTATTANRFGSSLAVSGNTLLIGAPLRTAEAGEVFGLTSNRFQSGQVYMLNLTNFWRSHAEDSSTPAPLNYIIQDAGYTTLDGANCSEASPSTNTPSGPSFRGFSKYEITHPLHIVGAQPGDQIGEVVSLHDINNDGLEDFVIGGPNTNGGNGGVYIIYRRPPEIEGDYLLENIQRHPNDPDRLNGLFIIGEPGQNLGTALGGGGPLNDDYNKDGFADVLIGIPNATGPAGFNSGQVFILFGGKNLLNSSGGARIADLRASGNGMLLTGAAAGDMAGTTVANAGDVNGDGVADILIAAPNASPSGPNASAPFDSDGDNIPDAIGLDLDGDGEPDDLDQDGRPDNLTNAGVVYVVFGGPHLTGTISLEKIGTADLPGFMIVGRKAGDFLGGGLTSNGLLSRGVASAGDVDGDGRADILISSILADPEGKTNAGEVYLVYGVRP